MSQNGGETIAEPRKHRRGADDVRIARGGGGGGVVANSQYKKTDSFAVVKSAQRSAFTPADREDSARR